VRAIHVIGLIDPAYGGPVVATLDLCGALHEVGVDVSLVTTDRRFGTGGRFEVRADAAPFPIIQFPAHWPQGYNASWRMARYLWKAVGDADVVHIHSVYGAHTLAAALAARRRGVPYVVEPHGALTRYHHQRKRWKKAAHERAIDLPLLRASAGIRCASPQEAADLAPLGLEHKAFVVPHGVAGPRDPLIEREETPAERDPVVLFLGRFHEKKRLDLTLDAFALVLDEVPSARLRLVGSGDEAIQEMVRRRTVELGLEDNIEMPGPVFGEARWSEFWNADAFVLLSDDESFGLTPVEAAVTGLPVIATSSVASLELIPEVAHPCSPSGRSAAEAVLSALRTPHSTEDRRALARTIEQRFAPTTIARHLVDHYNSVTGGSGR
jgi:glycosyltransferase involved in cell wall biosynthesis